MTAYFVLGVLISIQQTSSPYPTSTSSPEPTYTASPAPTETASPTGWPAPSGSPSESPSASPSPTPECADGANTAIQQAADKYSGYCEETAKDPATGQWKQMRTVLSTCKYACGQITAKSINTQGQISGGFDTSSLCKCPDPEASGPNLEDQIDSIQNQIEQILAREQEAQEMANILQAKLAAAQAARPRNAAQIRYLQESLAIWLEQMRTFDQQLKGLQDQLKNLQDQQKTCQAADDFLKSIDNLKNSCSFDDFFDPPIDFYEIILK